MSKRNFFSEQRSKKTGSRTHVPKLDERVSTHARITDGGAEGIVKISPDDIGETTTYCLPLSEEAFAEVSDFAFRALLEKQYENWENALQAGAERTSISDETIAASHGFQEIYQALNALMRCMSVALGGIHTVYDAYDSEIITVAAARARGYTSFFTADAADSDLFIVVHVLEAALADSTYGVDIAQTDNHIGQIVVQDSKVRYQAPKPDLEFDYAGGILPTVQTVEGDASGHWVKTQVAIPVSVTSGGGGIYYNPPNPNCCNPSAQPPQTPPSPPPPPTPPPDMPPVPPVNPPVESTDTVCSLIFSDNGNIVDVPFLDLVLEMINYGNSLVSHPYPIPLATNIHNWITTFVPDFDATCDILLSIKMKLSVTTTDQSIFGYIPNPFAGPVNQSAPVLVHINDMGDGTIEAEPIFIFPIDRKVISPITNIAPFPTFGRNFYGLNEYEIAIRDSDRIDGAGYEKWFFGIDANEYVTSGSLTPLDLYMCHIKYSKHQYLFHFECNGQDPVKEVGGNWYIYDVYGNGRLNASADSFDAPIVVPTDSLHPFYWTFDPICNTEQSYTQAVMYGRFACTKNTQGANATIHFFGEVLGNSGVNLTTASTSFYIKQEDGIIDFAIVIDAPIPSGTFCQIVLTSDDFPCDEYTIYDLVAYLA